MSKINYSLKLFTVLFILLTGISAGLKAQVSSYSFVQTTGTYTALTGGTVVATASGTSGAASLDDAVYTLANGTIPFSFTFNNVAYTGCFISTNGYITFGSAPAANGSTTGHTPLSTTTAFAGAASAMGRNLNSYFFSGNPAQTGEIRYQSTGSAPNRVFTVQWKNFKPVNTSGATFGPVLNFQVKLYETTNSVEFVYNCSGNFGATAIPAQVGLRGPNNSFPSNINNRSVTTGQNTWITSVAGTANSSVCEFSSNLLPPSGLIYRFAPAACPSPVSLQATNIGQTTAQLKWTSTGGNGSFKVEYGPSGFTPGSGTIINGATSPVNISNLTSQTTYQFYVQQNCGVNGNSTTVGPVSFVTGGPGEDCNTALLVSVANNLGACNFTTVTSGVSQNGPDALCSDAVGKVADDDKWYKFVAPTGGNSIVITTQAGSINDWTMEVWSGCPGSGSVIACAEDVNGFMPEITLCQNQYVPGQTYYIRAWTYAQNVSGTMSMCVYKSTACILPPVNDECISATRLFVNAPLSCPGLNQTFTTAGATASGDNATCDSGNKLDQWFVFNTGNFGDIRFYISPGTATSLKAQLLFECGGFEINCWPNANGNYQITGLNPQADYILRVWSDAGGAGTFNICLSDICANPTATISGTQAVCQGSSANLTVNFTGVQPYTFTYNNGTTNQQVVTNNNPYTLVVNTTQTRTYTLVSMSDGACNGSVSGSATVTVTNPQNASLLPFNPVCSNAGLQSLSGGSPSGGVYSGTGVSGGKFDPSVGTQTITYTVTYAPGCTRSASQVFTVNNLPNVNLGNMGTACQTASPFPLTGGSPSGGTYSGPGVSGNNFNPAAAGLGTKVITYSYTSAAGCAASDTGTITVITCTGCMNPPVANAGSDKVSCNNAPVTLSGSIGGGANSATWSGGNGTYTPSNTSLTPIYTPTQAEINSGQVRLILTTNDPDGSGPCIADRDTMFISFRPTPNPGDINGITGVCRPQNNNTFSVASQVNVNYSWTVPTNVVIAGGQGTSSITANWPSNGQTGDVCVTASNSCGTVQKCKKVTIRTAAPTQPAAITGGSSFCRTETVVFKTRKKGNADYYIWTPPIGATINGSSSPFTTPDTMVTVVFGNTFNGDTLRVVAGNCKGNSPQRKLRINRKTTAPGVPSSIVGTNVGVCQSTEVYTIRKKGGAFSYTWRTNIAGAKINGNASPYTTPDTIVTIEWPLFTANGSLFVKANNGCGSSAERSKTINPKPVKPTVITGPTSICRNASGVFTTPLIAGVSSYTWTVPSGVLVTSGQGTNTATIQFNTSAGTKAVKVHSNNACGSSGKLTLNVTVTNCPRIGDETEASVYNVEAYPNPADDRVRIELNTEKASEFTLMLTDMQGRTYRNIQYQATEGINEIDWDLNELSSGIYMLTVQGPEGIRQVKLMVE